MSELPLSLREAVRAGNVAVVQDWYDRTQRMLESKDAQLTECHLEAASFATEAHELNSLFDLQHRVSFEATEMWRKAHPGNEVVIPDLGALLDWFMGIVAKAVQVVAAQEAWCDAPNYSGPELETFLETTADLGVALGALIAEDAS